MTSLEFKSEFIKNEEGKNRLYILAFHQGIQVGAFDYAKSFWFWQAIDLPAKKNSYSNFLFMSVF